MDVVIKNRLRAIHPASSVTIQRGLIPTSFSHMAGSANKDIKS